MAKASLHPELQSLAVFPPATVETRVFSGPAPIAPSVMQPRMMAGGDLCTGCTVSWLRVYFCLVHEELYLRHPPVGYPEGI